MNSENLPPFASQSLVSFDGGTFESAKVFYPDRYRVLESTFKHPGPYSVQGAGLSYPALSFGRNSSVINLSHWRRILAFDQQQATIEVEAGMTLGELAQFSLKHDLFLKVQPGHPSITVGGCLGADVHGKNQRLDGNFKDHVVFLKLYHPAKGYLVCSRAENPEIFNLTCGGLGFTGVVLSIGLKLGLVKSKTVLIETLPIDSFESLGSRLETLFNNYELLYTWHDCTDLANWGRGFIKAAKFSNDANDLSRNFDVIDSNGLTFKPLHAARRGSFPGFNLMNSSSTRLINCVFKKLESRNKIAREVPLTSFLFPVAEKTFYFDLFGKNGFHESQVLFPNHTFEFAMSELKKGILKFKIPLTLASCKLFSGKQELLRFNGQGIVFAINFPRTNKSLEFLKWWDAVVLETKGLPSLIKDSRLSLGMVEKTYQQFADFKSALQRWDPERLFRNSLSERLSL